MNLPMTTINDNEQLAMYVEDEKIVINEGQIKGDFFVPTINPNPPNKGRLEKSVIRYGIRDLNQMINCGRQWAKYWRKSFTGIINLIVSDVRLIKELDVIHTPRSWENLHSDIIGWDSNIVFQRVQAEDLARKAKYLKS